MPAAEPVTIDIRDIELIDGATGAPTPLADLRDVNVLVILRHRH